MKNVENKKTDDKSNDEQNIYFQFVDGQLL
jgi:hypothetical protein